MKLTGLDNNLVNLCETLIQEKITGIEAISGGSINHARLIQSKSGSFFLKYQNSPQALHMFEVEAKGLALIANSNCIKTPEVLSYGQSGQAAYLLLAFLPAAAQTPRFWQSFGRDLAALHQISQGQYGLDHDNYIGSLKQVNVANEHWIPFFIEHRIKPQLKLAVDSQHLMASDMLQFDGLFQLLPGIIPEEPPALTHGDLWSGNFLCLTGGQAALIDPAVSFAHREIDLAMTHLFGGFSPLFYQAYHEAFPLAPNWEERMELYQLYYLLVHVNLFGGSYLHSVRRILNRFTS